MAPTGRLWATPPSQKLHLTCEGSASAALLIVVGEVHHHKNAHRSSRKSDSQSPDSHPFDQRAAIQFGRVQQDHFSPSWFRASFSRNSRRSNRSKRTAQVTHHAAKIKDSDQRPQAPGSKIGRSLLSTQAHPSRLHQPRERISNHHHCQRHQHQPQFFSPLVFRCLQDFMPRIFTQSDPVQPQQQTQQSDQQPVEVRRRVRTKSKPRHSSEISAVLQDIKEDHLPTSQDQINASH